MTKRSFHATFCDDIRHEVNGKISLIGCYGADMYVAAFPITLARLCVHFVLTTPKAEPFQGPIVVTVLNDDTQLVKADIPSTSLLSGTAEGKGRVERDFMAVVGGFEISPLQLQESTVLRIFADVDGETLVGQRLWISLRDAETKADE